MVVGRSPTLGKVLQPAQRCSKNQKHVYDGIPKCDTKSRRIKNEWLQMVATTAEVTPVETQEKGKEWKG